MEKPLTIKRAEFTQKLAQVINESELPAFVIADSLSAILTQINNLAQTQYQNDLQAYEQAQKEAEE
jgi:hypothetical protein